MTRPPLATAARAAVLTVVIAAVLWIVWALTLLLYVPRFEHVFRDFNMQLPASTVVVLAIGRWFAHYWYVAPFGLLLVLAVAAAGVLFLRKEDARWLSRLWAWTMVALPRAVLVFTGLALYLPLLSLAEALER